MCMSVCTTDPRTAARAGCSAATPAKSSGGRSVLFRVPKSAMPFGGDVPGVADLNGDGVDELVQAFYVIYAAVAGDTGKPLYPPAFLPGPTHFGKWIAYISPTVADLDGDGKLDVYLNSASYARGGYAAVLADGRPMWVEFHDNTEGSDGFGPVGDFDHDGKLEIAVPVLNGTLTCLNAADGKRKWTIKTPVTGDVVAADVNNDGILESVFAGRDGQMRAVSGKDGHIVWSIAATGRPVIADVDGDRLVEVLAVGGWDAPGNRAGVTGYTPTAVREAVHADSGELHRA